MSELAAGNGIRLSRRQIFRRGPGILKYLSQIANTQSAPKNPVEAENRSHIKACSVLVGHMSFANFGRSIWTYRRNIGEAVFAHRSCVVAQRFPMLRVVTAIRLRIVAR